MTRPWRCSLRPSRAGPRSQKAVRAPSRDHSGNLPPPVEICHCPPGPGNGRTYTSEIPDSSDAYASQCPSGEKAGYASLNGAPRNSSGFPSQTSGGPARDRLQSGAVKISVVARHSRLSKMPDAFRPAKMNMETHGGLPSVSRCASPDPSERIQYKPGAAGLADWNTMFFPSGVHTGQRFDSGQETQPRGSVPVQILHPDVVALGAAYRKRQPFAVGRKARSEVTRQAESAVAVSYPSYPPRRSTTPLSSRRRRGRRKFRSAAKAKSPPASVAADIFQNGRGEPVGARRPGSKGTANSVLWCR